MKDQLYLRELNWTTWFVRPQYTATSGRKVHRVDSSRSLPHRQITHVAAAYYLISYEYIDLFVDWTSRWPDGVRSESTLASCWRLICVPDFCSVLVGFRTSTDRLQVEVIRCTDRPHLSTHTYSTVKANKVTNNQYSRLEDCIFVSAALYTV